MRIDPKISSTAVVTRPNVVLDQRSRGGVPHAHPLGRTVILGNPELAFVSHGDAARHEHAVRIPLAHPGSPTFLADGTDQMAIGAKDFDLKGAAPVAHISSARFVGGHPKRRHQSRRDERGDLLRREIDLYDLFAADSQQGVIVEAVKSRRCGDWNRFPSRLAGGCIELEQLVVV